MAIPKDIPVIERQTTIKPSGSIPDFQGAYNRLANAGNLLSDLGAQVAQSASNQIAQKAGYNMGQNPQGDVSIPITQFDKTFVESYHAQAANTLSLRAQKMFDDSQIEMNKAVRLTPELIAKNNEELNKGIDDLISLAPTPVKGRLSATLKSQLLSDSQKYHEKMFTQQREDTRQQYIASVDLYTKQAYELEHSGESDAAGDTVKSAEMILNSGLDSKYLTPQEYQKAIENIRQARINGMVARSTGDAIKAGQFPEFARRWAEQKPEGMTQQEYENASQAIISQASFINSLRSQQSQINGLKFQEKIYQDVNGITQSDILELHSQVTPVQYEQLQLEYIKQKKKFNNERQSKNILISGFTDSVAFSRATSDQKDAAFNELVNERIRNVQIPMRPVSQSEAETAVALQAAGPVPAYIKGLNGSMASIDPHAIETSGQAIQLFFNRQKGANLEGLDERAIPMYNTYQALRRAMPAQEAAQEAYKAVYNQTPEEKKIVAENYSEQIKLVDNKLKFFSNMGGIDSSNLNDPLGYVEQAEAIYKSQFALTKGNVDAAKKSTADIIKNIYSESYINGKKETVYYPLEQAIGIPHDGVGYIQDDIIEHVNEGLKGTKEAFDKGKILYYWEVEPRALTEMHREKNVFGIKDFTEGNLLNAMINHREDTTAGSPIRIFKHWKNGTRETYNLVVKANPWNTKSGDATQPYTTGWDIVVSTGKGYEPLWRDNPTLGQSINYKPDVARINAKYNKEKGLK